MLERGGGGWRRLCAVGLTACGLAGCGPDADAQYAGLSLVEVVGPNMVGYRLRYLRLPWLLRRAGTAEPAPAGELDCRPLEFAHSPLGAPDVQTNAAEGRRDWCSTAEIPREGGGGGGDSVVLPKYYLEASIEECEAVRNGTAYPDSPTCNEEADAADESCAKRAARCELEMMQLRDSLETLPGAEDGIRASFNDSGDEYFEYMTYNSTVARFRRAAMYKVGDSTDYYVRLFISAFPRLDETEATRMYQAFDVFIADDDATDADGGSP